METRLEFWHRQTLRERPAEILADWKADNKKLEKKLQAQLDLRKKDLDYVGRVDAENKKLKADNDELRTRLCSEDFAGPDIQIRPNDAYQAMQLYSKVKIENLIIEVKRLRKDVEQQCQQ